MQLKLITLALAFAAAPALAAMGTTDIPTFAGQAAAQAAARNEAPKSPEEWLARMTDFSRNMSAFKDPKTFIPWTNAVTEPGFYIAMANGMMDPGGWLNMMNTAAHPDAVRNALAFADPSIYLKWSAASLDPNFYTALLTQLSDPGKLMRWGMVPMDPKLWSVLGNTINPNTYIRWPMAALDPRAWNLMGTVANPALYTGMAGAVVNPNAYGQGTNSWLTWAPAPAIQGAGSFAMWDPIAMAGNLSGWIPGLNQLKLPTLPSFTAPTQPAATPVPDTFPAPALVAAPTEVKPAAIASAPAPVQTHAPIEAKAIEIPKPAVAAKIAEAPKAVEVQKTAIVPAVVIPAPALASAPVPAPAPAPVASKMVLAGDALFKSGKSGIRDLSKEGRARLDEVVSKLNAMGPLDQIKVVGHADPTGNTGANRTLSEARAKSVKSYLIAKGVKPGVIVSSGMGDTQPVVQCDKALATDALKECHAPNRRVEIEVIAKAK
ncbi:MAG: hypothetical protein B7Y41_14365 [Hydrogenophilales bacterium 28-61-23]|nr:MAG: hypothetical protein B7Y41_14365 [Hydrogenophilales bacterium 28-61-23]